MTQRPLSPLIIFIFVAWLCAETTRAEVISSSPSHYVLKHTSTSMMPPNLVWQRLIKPNEWWHPDHTYSGSSDNLSLDLQAGGLWREDWDSGSVLHGQILMFQKEKTLVINAPFGPLQGMGVNVIWTISLSSNIEENKIGGTQITFSEIANGNDTSKLNEVAPSVDFVKQQAIERLSKPSRKADK